MANKSTCAILLSLLQDLSGNPSNKAGSTAAIAMADIKSDGLQKSDIENIAANSTIDQIGDPIQKVQYTFGSHPELIKELSD